MVYFLFQIFSMALGFSFRLSVPTVTLLILCPIILLPSLLPELFGCGLNVCCLFTLIASVGCLLYLPLSGVLLPNCSRSYPFLCVGHYGLFVLHGCLRVRAPPSPRPSLSSSSSSLPFPFLGLSSHPQPLLVCNLSTRFRPAAPSCGFIGLSHLILTLN